jgi:hypothetical protein
MAALMGVLRCKNSIEKDPIIRMDDTHKESDKERILVNLLVRPELFEKLRTELLGPFVTASLWKDQ